MSHAQIFSSDSEDESTPDATPFIGTPLQHLFEIYDHLYTLSRVKFTEARKMELLNKERHHLEKEWARREKQWAQREKERREEHYTQRQQQSDKQQHHLEGRRRRLESAWEDRKELLATLGEDECHQLVSAVGSDTNQVHMPLLLAIVANMDGVHRTLVINRLIGTIPLNINNVRQVMVSDIKMTKKEMLTKKDIPEDEEQEDVPHEFHGHHEIDMPIITAILNKDVPLEMIQMMMEIGVDPNTEIASEGPASEELGEYNYSALYCAVSFERIDVAKLLLLFKANVRDDYVDNFGECWTGDIVAAKSARMMELLLANGADPNAGYDYDMQGSIIPDTLGTVLIAAVFSDDLEAVQVLVRAGADIEKRLEVTDYRGDAVDFAYTIVCDGSMKTERDTYEKSLESQGLQNEIFWNGKEQKNSKKILQCLLHNTNKLQSHQNLLTDSVMRPGCGDIARMFLAAGVDVNFSTAKHREFETPLLCMIMGHTFLSQGKISTARLQKFCETVYGPDRPIEIQTFIDNVEDTLYDEISIAGLMYYVRRYEQGSIRAKFIEFFATDAMYGDKHGLLRDIIAKTNDINDAGGAENGSTPLINAIEHRSVAVVQLLLDDRRIDLNKGDNEGCTPLFAACRYSVGMVQKLLNAGCSVDRPADDGTTPLFQMCQMVEANSAASRPSPPFTPDRLSYLQKKTRRLQYRKDVETETNLQICELLLHAGADPNRPMPDGRTAVFVTRDVTLAILLLDNGGRPEEAHTDFQYAYQAYRAQLVLELRLARAILPRLTPRAQRMLLGLVGEHCAHCQKLLVGPSFATEPHLQICSKCHNERNPGFQVRHRVSDTSAMFRTWVSF